MALPRYIPPNLVDSWRTGNPARVVEYGQLGSVQYPLYRYTKKAWYDAARRSGNWRLATLFGFRDKALEGIGRADAGEGSRWDFEILSNMAGYNITFGGDCMNEWALCCAQERNDKFYEWPDNDCCLQIESHEFFIEIAKAMGASISCAAIVEMEYGSWKEAYEYSVLREKMEVDWEVDISRWKLPTEEWQAEIRFIAEPFTDTPLSRDQEIDWERPNDNILKPSYRPDILPSDVYAPRASEFISLVETRAKS